MDRGQAQFQTTGTLTTSGDVIVNNSGTLEMLGTVLPAVGGGYYLNGGTSTARSTLRGAAFVANSTTTVSQPIHVGGSAQARFYQNSTSNATVLSDVRFDDSNAYLLLEREGGTGTITVNSVAVNGTGNTLYAANAANTKVILKDFSGTGEVTVDHATLQSVTFDGRINTGAVVHYGSGQVDMRIFDSKVTANFQISGGTFQLDGAACVALPDTALTHTGKLVANAGRVSGTFPADTFYDGRERLHINYGESGKTWGDGLTLQIANSNPLNVYANDNAAGGIVNEVNAVVQVAAGDKGYLNAYPGSVNLPDTNAYGTVRLNHVQLGNGASLGVWAEDNGTAGQGTHLEMSFDLAGAGTSAELHILQNWGRSSRYIKDRQRRRHVEGQGHATGWA